MDRARKKFEEAYRIDSGVPYFAARVQSIAFTVALAFGHKDEGRRRFDEAAGRWEKDKPYYREHAPWMLKPREANSPERLGAESRKGTVREAETLKGDARRALLRSPGGTP